VDYCIDRAVEVPLDTFFLSDLGKAGDNIRINYREFVKDMARPAYFMEVTYPANPGKITFRNTQFEIIEVGESGLKFKLISTPTDKCQQVYYR
jgi:hypothetical protein